MVFASSSERPLTPDRPLGTSRSVTSDASHGIREMRLASGIPSQLSTPTKRCRLALASRFQPAGRVPPSWFLTTSTVCSSCGVPGVLQPGARRGSPRFDTQTATAARPSEEHPATPDDLRWSPQRLFAPLEEVPPTAAVLRPIVADRPLPFPSCRYAFVRSTAEAIRATTTLDFRALLRCRVRGAPRPLPVRARPLLPWALFPSRVRAKPSAAALDVAVRGLDASPVDRPASLPMLACRLLRSVGGPTGFPAPPPNTIPPAG